MPKAKFTINNTAIYGDALGVEGWEDAFKVRELWITTNASNAAALKSKIGRDYLHIEAGVLNIRVNGNNKVYGVKVSPGLDGGDGPGFRYLDFGSTEISMENGGVAVYTGFDANEYANINSGTKFSLVSAKLGDTHVLLKVLLRRGTIMAMSDCLQQV